MNHAAPIGIVLVLLALVSLSISALAWQAAVSADTLNPAQIKLLESADWMLKSSVSALIGFVLGWKTHPPTKR